MVLYLFKKIYIYIHIDMYLHICNRFSSNPLNLLFKSQRIPQNLKIDMYIVHHFSTPNNKGAEFSYLGGGDLMYHEN